MYKSTYAAVDWCDNDLVGEPVGDRIPALLHGLLVHATPNGSESKMYPYIDAVLSQCGKHTEKVKDKIGNVCVTVKTDKVPESRTLFSSHLDTVHRKYHKQNIMLSSGPLHQDSDFIYSVDNEGKRTILGADDKIGVFIMLSMILNKVPGTYIFHVGEEHGCIGSKNIRTHNEDFLKGYDRAIAFDRRGYGDIINHQSTGKCCSSEFVDALAGSLNKLRSELMGKVVYSSDEYEWSGARGSVTDTAQYTDVIPECTNLSVGYFDQHSKDERTDFWWLENVLMPSLLRIDWESLPVVRKVTDTGFKPVVKKQWTPTNQTLPAHNQLPTWRPILGLTDPYFGDAKDKLEWKRQLREWCSYSNVSIKVMDLEASAISAGNLKDDVEFLSDSMRMYGMEAEEAEEKASAIESTSPEVEEMRDILASLISCITHDVEESLGSVGETKVESKATDAKPTVTDIKKVIDNDDLQLLSSINFNAKTRVATLNDHIMSIYSKAGKIIKPSKIGRVSNGTKLHVMLQGKLHCIHEVINNVH